MMGWCLTLGVALCWGGAGVGATVVWPRNTGSGVGRWRGLWRANTPETDIGAPPPASQTWFAAVPARPEKKSGWWHYLRQAI